MKKPLLGAGAGAFLLFLVLGGAWVGLVRLIPDGVPQSVAIVTIGVAFASVYIWLLISRIRAILAGPRRLGLHILAAAVQILALLVAFGAVHQVVGITDNTRPGAPLIHDFWLSLYYSVVTFTTLGYGDYYAHGVGRVLAAIQALTGYIILGTLASTTASVLSPHDEAGSYEEQQGAT